MIGSTVYRRPKIRSKGIALKTIQTTFLLSNGVSVPSIGLGTWRMPEGRGAVDLLLNAIRYGYRHFDTAAIYGKENGCGETEVGEALRDSGLRREDFFVTSKLWNRQRGYDSTLEAFESTLAALDVDYLDLYLIHWPAAAHQFDHWSEINSQTWKAFEKLYKEGRIKAIGVSNFLVHHLQALLPSCEIKPMVNQIEYHPGFMQSETVAYCTENEILVEAWSPLGRGEALSNPILQEIAARNQITVAQLCIVWCLQNGVLPLPKSTDSQRIRENFDALRFRLPAEDQDVLNRMPFIGCVGLDPDKISF